MIDITKVNVSGFDVAIRGCRNAMNSWEASDSEYDEDENRFIVGNKDLELMTKLVATGKGSETKFRRAICVTMDICAPLYWWKEFDTYKVGTVGLSCSTMHSIHKKPFVLDDFAHDGLDPISSSCLIAIIDLLNTCRELYNETREKKYWLSMIKLLPSCYMQKRTVVLNYEVLARIISDRMHHKLDEWQWFCGQLMNEDLDYSYELVCPNYEN